MKLNIVTPERIVFSGEVSSVTVPGGKGRFTILKNHAPIISILEKGTISYRTSNVDNTMEISGGFVEVNNNDISIAIETVSE